MKYICGAHQLSNDTTCEQHLIARASGRPGEHRQAPQAQQAPPRKASKTHRRAHRVLRDDAVAGFVLIDAHAPDAPAELMLVERAKEIERRPLARVQEHRRRRLEAPAAAAFTAVAMPAARLAAAAPLAARLPAVLPCAPACLQLFVPPHHWRAHVHAHMHTSTHARMA
jgi:hypothetical protein